MPLDRVSSGVYVVRMTTTTQHSKFAPVGSVVQDAYWGKRYTVLAHVPDCGDWRGEQVTVEWEDGTVTTHSTPLGKRDRIIEEEQP